MSRILEGLILKGIGGFYYVEAAGSVYECRARGIFRKQRVTPLCGDRVTISIPETGMPMVDSIGERKNSLIRPPVANLDQLLIVASTCEPDPNQLVLDKLISIAVHKGIEPVVVVTKTDLKSPDSLLQIYRTSGIPVYPVSSETGEGIEAVKALLAGKISAFTGNSGVGKSSLLNRIDGCLGIETGNISHKLGRGRHTTREAQLYAVEGGYVADTPGFSSLELTQCERVMKDDLPGCFPEFEPFLGSCRFTSCAHTGEKGCAVKEAVERGEIHPARYQSYVELYEEVRDLREWQFKK
ncbi:MAG: ribosome small subunit-dependent GTPase A [Clostridiales bacterium]|nr:ribosome small subunit-dependent GTPase A [Clostridiales bacterium]